MQIWTLFFVFMAWFWDILGQFFFKSQVTLSVSVEDLFVQREYLILMHFLMLNSKTTLFFK